MTFSWPCNTVPTTNDNNNPLLATNSVPGTFICNSHFIPPYIAMKEILRTLRIKGSEKLKVSPEITFLNQQGQIRAQINLISMPLSNLVSNLHGIRDCSCWVWFGLFLPCIDIPLKYWYILFYVLIFPFLFLKWLNWWVPFRASSKCFIFTFSSIYLFLILIS